MPTAVQKTAELGSHNTHGEQQLQQQQQPQPDENSNSYNSNNNKGYCLVAPVDCSSARGEYRSCCAGNRRRLCSTWPNCQRYLSLPPRPYPQHPFGISPRPLSTLSDDRLLRGDRLIDDLFILIGWKSLLALVQRVDFANVAGPKYQVRVGVFLFFLSRQSLLPPPIVHCVFLIYEL